MKHETRLTIKQINKDIKSLKSVYDVLNSLEYARAYKELETINNKIVSLQEIKNRLSKRLV